MPECKSCKARILWVKTEKGGTMPLDEVPVAVGTISLVEGVARVVPKEERESSPRLFFTSHFATCPQAKQHRRKT